MPQQMVQSRNLRETNRWKMPEMRNRHDENQRNQKIVWRDQCEKCGKTLPRKKLILIIPYDEDTINIDRSKRVCIRCAIHYLGELIGDGDCL